MGSYFSNTYHTNASSTNTTNVEKLETIINTQKQHIGELRDKIQLLQCKRNSTHCIREGTISLVDENITETISEN